VAHLERSPLRAETLGLSLAEARSEGGLASGFYWPRIQARRRPPLGSGHLPTGALPRTESPRLDDSEWPKPLSGTLKKSFEPLTLPRVYPGGALDDRTSNSALDGMKSAACFPQPYRICGRTVYVYKGGRGGSHRRGWCFWLAGREPVEGFQTRQAALEQARKSLAA
jgi:hypothetical protein